MSVLEKRIRFYPFTVEYLAPGLIYEHSADGSLASFILEGQHIGMLEAWILQVKRLLLAWSVDKPCLMLHDLRNMAVCEAMDLLYGGLELKHPRLKLYTALVIESNATRPCREKLTEYPYHIFLSRHTALFWLLEQVTD
jgi:hypothetical protein